METTTSIKVLVDPDKSSARRQFFRSEVARAQIASALPGTHAASVVPETSRWKGVETSPDAGRGRDASYPAPPAQIRASVAHAHGSYLGCLAANRSFGQGWRISTGGGTAPLVAPESASRSNGCIGETPSIAPRWPVRHDIGIPANHGL